MLYDKENYIGANLTSKKYKIVVTFFLKTFIEVLNSIIANIYELR